MKTQKFRFRLILPIILILAIIPMLNSPNINNLPLWNNISPDLAISEKATPLTLWENNGSVICNETNEQTYPAICSDGDEGAIIAWSDNRNGSLNSDIYVQRINSSGNIQWEINGVALCTKSGNQFNPQICSDGDGGAIIIWVDEGGINADIYAQKINSSGNVKWMVNGTPICNASGGQYDPQLCSDGNGGAIITWYDGRGVANDIYAQWINSSGNIQWATNGIVICNASGMQLFPKICSAGVASAIITWRDMRADSGDIYAQKVNSTGHNKWIGNGSIICTANGEQNIPEICTDGAAGAIITWQDLRGAFNNIYAQRVNSSGFTEWLNNGTGIDLGATATIPKICSDGNSGAIITWQTDDIYAQRVNSTGDGQWSSNVAICSASGYQQYPKICSDGLEGALITWEDPRGSDYDIYVQWVNSTGYVQWGTDGAVICNETNNQNRVQITSDDSNGAIITWEDNRTGSHDVYAQRIKNIQANPPTSNNPIPIITYANGSETINWTLYDDFGSGQYRVWANDTIGNFYIWVDWTIWTNNTQLNVTINRTAPGIYNYTIEYYDVHNQFGLPDTVIVTIIDQLPTSDHPSPITTNVGGSETINWTLYDDFGSGQYRVWANDTNDNYYLWVNWIAWTNNTQYNITINRTAPGIYNYTIEFNDNYGQLNTDTIIVNITDAPPSIYQPPNINTTTTSSDVINWTLYDDWGSGYFRVRVNDTNNNYYVWIDWTAWTNATTLNIAINRSAIGFFNYTIEFNTSTGQFLTDTVFVNITRGPSPSEPNILVLLPLLLPKEDNMPLITAIIVLIALGAFVGLILVRRWQES